MTQGIKIQAAPAMVDRLSCSFTADQPIYPEKAAFFANKEEAAGSPLAESLFSLQDVAQLLIAEDTVHVSLAAPHDWQEFAPRVGKTIREHMQSGQPAVSTSTVSWWPPIPLKEHAYGMLKCGSDQQHAATCRGLCQVA